MSAHGCVGAAAAAQHDEFRYPQNVLASAVLSPNSIEMTITEIRSVVASESDEDKASEGTVQRAIQIIEEANANDPVYLAASEIEGFEGKLLIHWKSGDKQVSVISPREPEQPLSLYKRLSTGWSELTTNPTPRLVSSAIAWVLQ